MSLKSQKSLAGGELSPELYPRTDTVKYQTGVKTATNFYVRSNGGMSNRPGTEHVGYTRQPGSGFIINGAQARLIPFVFNSDQTYVIELTDSNYRFIKDGAFVTNLAGTGIGITNIQTAGGHTIITANSHGLTSFAANPLHFHHVLITGVGGMTELNNRTFVVLTATANTFEIGDPATFSHINSSTYGAYTSGGSTYGLYLAASTYDYDEIFEVQYAQSADVLTFVHPDHIPKELTRASEASWSEASTSYSPVTAAPSASLSAVQGGATGSTTYTYVVTTVAQDTFEESLASASISNTSGNATLSATNYMTVSWTAVSGAQEYNVYKNSNGVYGFIGVAYASSGTVSFVDTGIVADTTIGPPNGSGLIRNSTNLHPSAIALVQQRRVYGGSNDYPDMMIASKIGLPNNFTRKIPLADDDAVFASMYGKRVHRIRHLVDLGLLVVFTSEGEFVIQGNNDGIITPSQINPKQKSAYGSGDIAPLEVDGNALFVQKDSSKVRDLFGNIEIDGYRGNDLTTFSSHLFENHTIVDWTYQQRPHSIVWAVRDDGVLLSLTYVKEQQIWAWTKHDMGGTVKSVCAIPEGTEDSLYMVVRRDLPGVYIGTGGYMASIEKMSSMTIDDVVDCNFLDNSLLYDGRHTGTTTMTLSSQTSATITGISKANPGVVTAAAHGFINGQVIAVSEVGGMTEIADGDYIVANVTTNTFTLQDTDGNDINTTNFTTYTSGGLAYAWDYSANLRLTASASTFASTDVGNEIHLTGSDGSIVRFQITAYSSATIVTGNANITVPETMRGGENATSTWSRAVDEISGLWHLEGEDVGVFADGFVVANPLDGDYPTLTVENGAITLPRCFGVVRVGLPFVSDLETLSIDTVNGKPAVDEMKLVTQVNLSVHNTRGLYVGTEAPSSETSVENLDEPRVREEESMDEPVDLFSGNINVNVNSTWNDNGRVFIRQIDPLPVTIMSITPGGYLPTEG